MKKIANFLVGIIILMIGVLCGMHITDGTSTVKYSAVEIGDSKFGRTLELIDNKYVETIDVDTLLDKIIPDLISKLDPHSAYIAQEDMVAVNETIEGEFDGVGIVFNMATDTVIILNVIASGPGAKAGVEPGDRIIMVDDSLIAGVKMDQMDVMGMLRGKRGTEVTLAIERGDNPELMDFTLVRDVISINSVEASFMTRDSSAYVLINTFAEHTHYDALMAINELVSRGAKSVIIDLRANGGGLMDQALLLANEFLEKGQTIVYIEGEHFQRREQRADGRGAFQTIPLYVVIDESSASASEIFAGAIQDNDRGTIIGRRSFGKGLIQEQIPFSDGSALRLTIAKYYTPLGRPLQKPYVAGDATSYEAELLERFTGEEVTTGVNAHIDSTVTYTTPEGRVLYGGGGITPDIFVPVDTTKLPDYFVKLYQNNAIFPFAQKYADKNRSAINSIKTLGELDEFFAAHPNLYSEFIDYAVTVKGLSRPTAKDTREAKDMIITQLKAYIGRYTSLQESAFYYYNQKLDRTMQRLFE